MEPPDPNATPGLRPSSVPSWMSELKGQSGVPTLPPRQRAAHLIDGAAPTSRRGRPSSRNSAGSKARSAAARRSAPTKKERAPPRSLTESWESLRLFGRKNLGRRLEEEPRTTCTS